MYICGCMSLCINTLVTFWGLQVTKIVFAGSHSHPGNPTSCLGVSAEPRKDSVTLGNVHSATRCPVKGGKGGRATFANFNY